MNQMGHETPNLIGANTAAFDAKIRKLIPSYMTMGAEGMGGHAEHVAHMRLPRNSIPMRGAPGPFSYIDMGGMFTIIKIRKGITSYEDPGWYEHPKGEVATNATAEELARDGIEVEAAPPAKKHQHHDHG
jgi:hypothetical protein